MPRLLEQVQNLIRTRHYRYRTEQTYSHRIKQYIFFHGERHPADMGAAEVSEFLTHLAVTRRMAASTRNQALAALQFLYRHVLGQNLPGLENVERAKRPARLPLVLTKEEVKAILAQLQQQNWLMASRCMNDARKFLQNLYSSVRFRSPPPITFTLSCKLKAARLPHPVASVADIFMPDFTCIGSPPVGRGEHRIRCG